MMNYLRNIHIIWFLIPVILLVTACESNRENFVAYEHTGSKEVIEEEFFGIDKRSFEVSNMVEQTFYFGDHKISMPQDGIYDTNGNLFQANCNLDIEISSQKAALIFNQISTIEDGEVIDIQHLINAELSVDDNIFDFGEEKPMLVNLSSQTNILQKLYALTGEGAKEWKETDQLLLEKSSWTSNGSNYSGYEVKMNHTGWLGIGNKIKNVVMRDVNICVDMPKYFDGRNTLVYAVFDNYNSVLKLDFDEENNRFCNLSIKKPLNAALSLISISVLGEDDFYFTIKSAVVEKEVDINLVPEVYSLEEIIAQIKAL